MYRNLQYVGLVRLLRWSAKLRADVVGFGDVQRVDKSTSSRIVNAKVQCPLDRINVVVDTANVVVFVGSINRDLQLKLDTVFGGCSSQSARSKQ